MKKYQSKEAFKNELVKQANLFISEFNDVAESERDLMKTGVDRSPAQMLAYQLGWMDLLLDWEREEKNGIEVITPAPGFQWNKLGSLYESFYQKWNGISTAITGRICSSPRWYYLSCGFTL